MKGSLWRAYNGESCWRQAGKPGKAKARQGKSRRGKAWQDAREGLALSLSLFSFASRSPSFSLSPSLSRSSYSLPLPFSLSRVRPPSRSRAAAAVSQPFRGYVTLKKLFGVNTPRSSDTCSTSRFLPFLPLRSPPSSSTPRTRRQPSPPLSPSLATPPRARER